MTGRATVAFARLREERGPGRDSGVDGCGRNTMRSDVRPAPLLAGALTLALAAAGCGSGGDTQEAVTQTARETVGVKGSGTERTVESRRHVIVQDTKKVIDADTGQVLKTEETKTPVTVTEKKTVEHKVDVKTGETKKTVE
jgi:hypothetical protein